MGKEDESILVFAKDKLPPVKNGVVIPDKRGNLEGLIRAEGTFMRRGDAEYDESWKQVIPYLIFRLPRYFQDDQYFLMQRTEDGDEERLRSKYSLGIGGHVNEEDFAELGLMGWARREFDEEVWYSGRLKERYLGIINDDSIPVNRVHLGLVILLAGDNGTIGIKDEHQSGELITLTEMRPLYKRMESWTQIVYQYLKAKESRQRRSESGLYLAQSFLPS